jgi:hypothetical protein
LKTTRRSLSRPTSKVRSSLRTACDMGIRQRGPDGGPLRLRQQVRAPSTARRGAVITRLGQRRHDRLAQTG